jgi:anti-sigma factor RsiW
VPSACQVPSAGRVEWETVSCEQFEPQIGELVDGTLDGAPRHALEAHLSTCPTCARLVDDLLVVRRAARALPPLAPPARLKPRVEDAVARDRHARQSKGPWRRFVLPLTAAAVIVLAVAAGLLLKSGADAPATPQTTATTPVPVDPETATEAELIGSVEAELQQTERHLERAVTGLEVLARDRQTLDPQVAAEVQKNMLVIDRAIGESRAALRTDPLSAEAQDSLFEAFRAKIALLQDTVSLINEVRKGNQAEVARIADGMNKS